MKLNKKNKKKIVPTWCRAQLHSAKPELKFCAGSNPACDVSEIRDGKDF